MTGKAEAFSVDSEASAVMMHLAIVGSRTYDDVRTFQSLVDDWICKHGRPATIISGGARGVDTLASLYARENSIPLRVFQADWKTHGRAAGPLRNQQIVDVCTHVLAFPSEKGRGTQDTIRRARASGREVTVYVIEKLDSVGGARKEIN